jgi:hypothetical protein
LELSTKVLIVDVKNVEAAKVLMVEGGLAVAFNHRTGPSSMGNAMAPGLSPRGDRK